MGTTKKKYIPILRVFKEGNYMLSNQEIEKGIRQWSRKIGIGSYLKPIHSGDSRELVVYGGYITTVSWALS